jgi:hypothetical protein
MVKYSVTGKRRYYLKMLRGCKRKAIFFSWTAGDGPETGQNFLGSGFFRDKTVHFPTTVIIPIQRGSIDQKSYWRPDI